MIAKTPSHATPRYLAARIRKLFVAKGWPVSVTTGRYAAFGGGTQYAPEGFRVSKVGRSKWISIGYSPAFGNGRTGHVSKEVRQARNKEAADYLRSLGYRVDERGWIECEEYDERDV